MLSETYRLHKNTTTKKILGVLVVSQLINSQLLYQLSYRGISVIQFTIGFYTNLSIRATFFLPVLFLKVEFYL